MDELRCITIKRTDEEFITVCEWESIIESDPELLRIEFNDGINPMNFEPMKIPLKVCAVVWLAHSMGYKNPSFIFKYEDGTITALNVDNSFVTKGKEIAHKLNAVIIESID